MPALFVLDVPEFRPIVDEARKNPSMSVEGPVSGYFRVSADMELRIDRASLGLEAARWFGAVCGGFHGRELVIDEDALILRGDPKSE